MSKFNKVKERILNSKTEFKLWQKFVTVLSCFAVFVTVYSLILPAITINTDDTDLIPGFVDPLDAELNDEINEELNNEPSGGFNYEIDELLDDGSLIEEETILNEAPLEEVSEHIDDHKISENTYVVYVEVKTAKRPMLKSGRFGISPPPSLEIDPLLLDDRNTAGSGAIAGKEIYWRVPGTTQWNKYVESTSDSVKIPANAEFKVTISFNQVDRTVLKNHGYKLQYNAEQFLKDLNADGVIKNKVTGETVGYIASESNDGNNVVVLDFYEGRNWLDNFSDGSTLESEFTYTGRLDLSNFDGETGDKITLAGIEIPIFELGDGYANFADIDLTKQIANNNKIIQENGKYYLEYVLTVSAGRDGAKDVKVIDTVTAGLNFLDESSTSSKYYNVTNEINQVSNIGMPFETISNNDHATHGSVYLTNDTKDSAQEGEPSPVEGNDFRDANLAWYIGNMTPYEERTLTYRVQIKDDYVGIRHNNAPISNSADVILKNIKREHAETNYTPIATVNLTKTSTNAVPQEDGTYRITFVVTIKADANNTYTLTDMRYYDYVNRGSRYQEYVNVDEASIKILKDSNTEYQRTENEVSLHPEYYEIITKNYPDGFVGKHDFNVFIGDLAPGETKIVKYDIIADEAKIEQMDIPGHNAAQVVNQGDLFGDTVKQPNELYKHVDNRYDIARFNWVQKYSGNRVENTLHFEMENDSVYDGTTPKPAGVDLPKISDVTEFTVPAGSYKYQIMLNGRNNETKWDLTDTRWTDNISPVAGAKYLELTGYACVELYDQIMVNSSSNMTTVGNLISRKWVKIDGDSFDFSASQIGANKPSPGAYLITYYAKVPDSVMGFTRIDSVKNNFNITGNAYYGEGETIYLNLNRSSSVTQSVIEPDGLNAQKRAWYYDPNDTSFADCPNKDSNGNGVLYWTIELTGSRIYQGYELKDYIESNSNMVTHNNDAFVGIYKVKYDSLEEYENQNYIKEEYGTIDKLLEAVDRTGSNITTFDNSIGYYMNDAIHTNGVIECSSKNNSEFKYHFSEGYNLDDLEKVILVVRTEPKILPADNQTLNYSNVLQFSYDSINWKFSNRAEQPIVGPNGSVKKTAGSVYKKEGNSFTRISGNDTIAQNVNYDWGDSFYSGWTNSGASSSYWNDNALAKDGTYVSWIIDINKLQKASGEYDIVDYLPSGVELCYIQMTNCYNNFRATGNDSKAWDAYYRNGSAYGNTITKGPMPSGGWNLNSYSLEPNNGWAFTYTREKDEWLGDGFIAHRTASPVTNTSGGSVGTNDHRTSSIFYVKQNSDNTQEVRIHLPYVQQNNQAQFRVVCRLTEDGEREKIFGDIVLNNNVAMFDKNGIQVDYSSSEMTITGGGVNKNLLTANIFNSSDSHKLATTVFPYRIVVNESKVDMLQNSDYIALPLIDRMTGNMSIELSTLKIYADENLIYYGGVYASDALESDPWYTTDSSKIGMIVGDLRDVPQKIVVQPDRLAYDENGVAVIGIDGTQMKEIAFGNLPDSSKITIEYSVSVQLKENRLKFDNQAFWEGFQDNKGGDSDDMDYEYQAEATAGENEHGSLSIYKYDSKDIATPLADAVFGLYRVEYKSASEGYVFIKDSNNHYVTGDYEKLHLIAVFQDVVVNGGNKSEEIKVRRSANIDDSLTSYIIDKVEIIKNDGQREWMDISEALSKGYRLHHEFDLNDDGSFKLCSQGALAIGKTDDNGRLSYGFGENDKGIPVRLDEDGKYIQTESYPDDRIHFNKVYAVKELKAPEGYILDETIKYFVVPNDKQGYNGTLLNYFYHEEWPDGVTVVNKNSQQKLNFELNMPNDTSAITVTKKFGGNITGDDLVAGEYKFALYSDVDRNGNPIGTPLMRRIVYTDQEVSDYKDMTDKANYNFKSVEFSNLLPGNYYLFELDDKNIPIRSNTKATINGNLNTVTYSNTVNTNVSNKIEISANEGRNVQVDILNSRYAVKVTKKFSDASGELLNEGLAGEYLFGIWEKDQNLTEDPIKTLKISWKVYEKDANKTAIFDGLDPNKEYVIYELDKDNSPVSDGVLADFDSNKKYVVNYGNHVNYSGLITEGNDTPEVTVINAATVKLPNSGSSGTKLYKCSGLALMAGTIIISKYKRRKEERRRN